MAESILSQRLLGAAVIVSLGFIGYALFLQSGPEQIIDKTTQIPIQSEYVEPLDFDPPKGVEVVPQTDVDTFFNSTEVIKPATIKDQPLLDEQGLPNSWIIKVGSFSTEDKSIEIRDQLIAKGYKAYVRPVPESTLYRVLVGPYLGSDEVQADQAAIDKMLSVETALIKNEP